MTKVEELLKGAEPRLLSAAEILQIAKAMSVAAQSETEKLGMVNRLVNGSDILAAHYQALGSFAAGLMKSMALTMGEDPEVGQSFANVIAAMEELNQKMMVALHMKALNYLTEMDERDADRRKH